MPRIPGIVSGASYGGPAQGPRVNPDLGAARAINVLGDTSGRLAQVLQERDVQEEKARQESAINAASLDGIRWLAERQAAIAAAPDPRPLAASFRREAEAWGRDRAAKLGVDDDGRAQFAASFERAALAYGLDAQEAARRATRDEQRAILTTGLDALEQAAIAAPNLAAALAAQDQARDMIVRSGAAGFTGLEEAAKLQIAFRQSVASGYLQAQVEANPAAVAAATAPPGMAPGTVPSGGSQAVATALVDGGLIHTESRGRQDAVSPAGAVGVAQVMPGTGPEAAQAAGLPWDETRWREDAEYNRALGVAYLAKMLDRYGGDQVLALTAYNQGPGNVDKYLETIGDPRGAQITHDQWLNQLPGPDGRAYARAVLARMGTTPAAVGAARAPVDPRLAEAAANASPEVKLAVFRRASERIEAQAREAQRLAREAAQVAEAEARQREAETVRLHRESVSSILAGQGPVAGFGDADVIANVQDPGQRQRMLDQLDVARAAETTTSAFASMPAAEIDAQVESLKPPRGTDGFEFRQQVYLAAERQAQAVLAARAKDPAAAIGSLPQMRALNEAARTDPTQLAAYGRAMLAEQQRLGVPPSQQRLIPEALAKQSVADLMATPPEQRPEAFRAFVEATQGWGELRDRALGEFVAAGLPDAAVGALIFQGDQQAVSDLMLGLSWPDDVRTKIVTGTAKTDLANGLSEALSDLLATEPDPVARQRLTSVAHELALVQIQKGKDVSAAVAAVAETMAKRWTVVETYRVPAGVDADAIDDGTWDARTHLKPGDLMPADRVAPWERDESLALAPIQDIRAHGWWQTSHDETGLDLMHANGQPALRPDGTRYSLTWDELAAAGRQGARRGESGIARAARPRAAP